MIPFTPEDGGTAIGSTSYGYRFATVDLKKVTGLTFVWYHSKLTTIHGHTPAQPFAGLPVECRPHKRRKDKFQWTYVPIPPGEEIEIFEMWSMQVSIDPSTHGFTAWQLRVSNFPNTGWCWCKGLESHFVHVLPSDRSSDAFEAGRHCQPCQLPGLLARCRRDAQNAPSHIHRTPSTSYLQPWIPRVVAIYRHLATYDC